MNNTIINLKVFICILVTLLLMRCSVTFAEDLKKLADLSGYWKFSIGDNPDWAKPDFDDSDWDKIHVPKKWEEEGYDEYNGYAWYRTSFNFTDVIENEPLYLVLGYIDDANEVYLNGRKLGKNGDFPPKYNTAYYTLRKYYIPKGFLNPEGNNVLAVKVYDSFSEGGIVSGDIGIFVDKDFSFMNIVLSGEWKFKTGDSKFYRLSEFDDSKWHKILVPSLWDNVGYQNYDGYGWYRKTFKISSTLAEMDLYLCMGKIDDYDQVYLNGKLIGNVFELKRDWEYTGKGMEHNARRVYKIPDGLLNPNGINTIAVRVYDGEYNGGIYEGPIGIMTKENYLKYSRKYYHPRTLWDIIVDNLNIEY